MSSRQRTLPSVRSIFPLQGLTSSWVVFSTVGTTWLWWPEKRRREPYYADSTRQILTASLPHRPPPFPWPTVRQLKFWPNALVWRLLTLSPQCTIPKVQTFLSSLPQRRQRTWIHNSLDVPACCRKNLSHLAQIKRTHFLPIHQVHTAALAPRPVKITEYQEGEPVPKQNPVANILSTGSWPTLCPGRRDWSQGSIQSPLPTSLRWPPKNWETLSSAQKQAAWLAVSTILALKDEPEGNFPTREPSVIKDDYSFLALPGSGPNPTLVTPIRKVTSELRLATHSTLKRANDLADRLLDWICSMTTHVLQDTLAVLHK